MADKKILITGGAGFIGSNLVNRLLKNSDNVLAIDNLITGSTTNLEFALQCSNFKFINHDITKGIPSLPFIPDHIYHLASPASVPDYQKYPLETAMVNSKGTHIILDYAKTISARVLFASTSEVYGDPKEHPQKENYWGNVNPVGIRACYDESKRFGEMLMTLYAKNYAVDARVMRIFNTYGPHMRPDDGRVVSNFINQILRGEDLTIYGTGNQTRSFCYIDDLVDAIILYMNTENLSGEIINLGNPEEFTVRQLADIIIKQMKVEAKITFKSLPCDDPQIRKPDISKAFKLLGWKPKVGIQEGIKRTVSYYKTCQ